MLRSLLTVLLFSATLPAFAQGEWKAYSTPGGQAAEALALPDLAGKTIDLAELRGEVVLVNFWATWCVPCREEMPSLDRLHRQFKGRKLRVIGVNIGEGKARIEQFLAQVPAGFSILRDADTDVMKAWKVRVLPATFLVDGKGMLRYQLVGEADWDDPALRAPIIDLLKENRSWSSSSSVTRNSVNNPPPAIRSAMN